MTVKNALYEARDKLFRSATGVRLLYLCKISGVYWKFARYYAKKRARRNLINPTPQMLESRKFFSDNADRIDKVKSLLADDTSKDCYRKMIDFRCTYNADVFPACDENAQYFFHDFIKYSNEEVLVDCGAFVGDSVDFFIRVLRCYNGKYKQIIAFEPDLQNYEILQKRKIPRLMAINAGVYSSDTTLYFDGGHSRCSFFIENVNTPPHFRKLAVKSIDNCIECHNATFIKMDIEGSELPALHGAEKTIRKNKPTLAICIYHSDEDMIRIIEWIYQLHLDYRFYVRQYNAFNVTDTVLYAVQ